MSVPRKTAMVPTSLRRSAIPQSESRAFLQIYQLTAERKRLERQVAEWKARMGEAEVQLARIANRIEELQEQSEVLAPKKLSVRPKRKPMGPGGTLVLEY
jgi:chromosome segregation ATPase